ncbi:helix-turn-helix domain-containing protein [Streptomyces sp. NPDC014685]|uniref:helix-turn-helix domain-containing protein n=1 Tax=Streptomyces sp. NPDC014685 TaxID=3364881 RepID=UPI0036FCD198
MELTQQVGSRLRELRVERNLSLSALARRSGVGKGTLSELEAGRRNATLETLYALTTALGIPLTAVLGPEPARAPLSGRAVDAVLVERYEDSAATTEIYRIRIRTGVVQESDGHPSGTEEHLIVLSGTARVGAASAPVEAGPGEHAHWPADIPHVYAAVSGNVEAILTVRYPAR